MRNRSSLLYSIAVFCLFVLLEVCSVLLITNNSIVQRYKILGSVRSIQISLWQGSEQIRQYFNLKEENRILVEENASLKQRLSLYQDRSAEQDSVLLDYSGIYSYLPATIIKNSTNKQHNYLILNKGKNSGVEIGMGVVTDCGVVGIVNSVSNKYAFVISFLNKSQAVSAKVIKNNYFGPMVWDGINYRKARMYDVSLNCNTSKGDTVATSGFSNIFPPDIPLGTVSDFKIVSGTYKQLDIDLFQDFRMIKNVYIVLNKDIKEIQSLEEE